MSSRGFPPRRKPFSPGRGPLGRPARSARAALAALAAAALLWGAPAAEPAQKATLILNWLPGGAHAPLFYGRDKGFFRKEGLEVKIVGGRGSRDALARMQGGESAFALAEASEIFSHRAGGFDTLGVMVYFERSPNAILTLKRPDIRRLADLAGRRIAAPRASFPRMLFPELRAGARISLTRIRWSNLAPSDLLPALIGGKVDAVASSSLAAYQYRKAAGRRGKELSVFPYAEAGVNPYSLVLVSMDSVLAKDASLARAFVRAAAASLAAAVERPREALETFLKANPTLGRERIGAEWAAALALIYPEEARKGGLGKFREKRLKEMQAMLGRTRKLKFTGDVDDIYTNQFVPAARPRPGKL